MKKLFSIILFTVAVFTLTAQTGEQTCHFGITFEISQNPNWGYGEPVILTVEPHSPAALAGIKPGEIIMEINGGATYLRNYQTISSWLFNIPADNATFTIRNMTNYFKEYELPRECHSINAISESDLASSFSFYSLENAQERLFVLPLKVTTNKDVDYSDYHSFDFIQEPNSAAIDSRINKQLEDVLKAKGLTRTNNDPDILIQTYYSYQPNPRYNPSAKPKTRGTWRYNMNAEEIIFIPALSGDDPQAEMNGQFVLEFGVRFFDKKYIDTQKLTLMWEASVREYLTSTFTLEEYIPVHAPLIMMQFPYSTDRETATYQVSLKKYYYTGLYFDINNMKRIKDVDRNSPAYKAGLRPNMVVDKINDIKFKYSQNDLTNGYKRFISETMKYRDRSTRFTDANGFPDAMYWKRSDYPALKKVFEEEAYAPVFKYLYSFENYISGRSMPTVSIETKAKKYDVTPEIRSSKTIRAL